MTSTPTASLTTAADLQETCFKLVHQFSYEPALGGKRMIIPSDALVPLAEAMAALLTTFSAQVRRDALEWRDMDTAPMDGTPILLFTTCHGITEAWFSLGEWSEDTPVSPREYSGDVWVCADDEFQIEAERSGPDGSWSHGTATAWMPKPPAPSPVKAGGEG